ncbi:MAG TPA: histidine kinase [Saprospiraceae bacterium]|nr:histidine kinase [Saprospiraceae bacterium]
MENTATDRALDYARRAAQLADSLQPAPLRLETSMAYGKALRKSGAAKESTAVLLDALALAEAQKDKTWQLALLTQIGWGFFVQKETELCLDYFDKAERVGRMQSDSSALARMYMDKGMVLQSLERVAESYACFDRAYQLYVNIGRHDVAAHMLAFIYPEHPGWLCFLDEAQLKQARDAAKASGSDYFLTFSALQDAGCHAKAGRCGLAEQDAAQAWKSAQALGDLVLLSMTADRLVEVFQHCKNFEQAFHFQTQALIFHDSLAQKEKREEVNRLLLERELKETALLAEQNELQQKNISILKRRNALALILSAALAVIFVLTYRLLASRARRKRTELQSQLYLIRLRPHFLYNILGTLQHTAFADTPERVAELTGRLGQMFRSFFDVSHQEFISLSREREVLEEYIAVQRMRFTFPFTFRFSISEDIQAEDLHIPPMLLQPFVENALEHGCLHTAPDPCICVSVSLLSDKRLQMEITDNGCGMSADKLEALRKSTQDSGSGIGITMQRIRLLGGRSAQFHFSTFQPADTAFPGLQIRFSAPYRRSRI